MENLFFNFDDLHYLGKNSIIGKTVRIRYPELVSIGDNCIIDDFTYISTKLELSDNVHISSGCKLIGGKNSTVTMGKFSTTSPNVVLAAGTDDYIGGIGTPIIPSEFKGDSISGKIELNDLTIIGANSVILPNVKVGKGSSLGALSLANSNLEEWYLYAGVPAKKIKKRNKEQILKLLEEYLKSR
tara:strand:+ start:2216 stop:2770 length:555 start_codon:yes stop_codon:yes gene_type:complete